MHRALVVDGEDEPFVTNWYLVVEFADSSGEPQLSRYAATDSAPWQRIGLLRSASIDEERQWVQSQPGDDDAG